MLFKPKLYFSFAFVTSRDSKGHIYLSFLTWLVMAIILMPVSVVGQDKLAQSKGEASVPDYKMLVFSGSDWCLPCINFDRQVLQNQNFESFSELFLEVEIADFPQHKELSKDVIRYNEALAEKYNPQGYFPHVLLLDKDGKVLTEIKTNKRTAEQVIEQIKLYLPKERVEEVSVSLILMGSSFQITIVVEKNKGLAYLAESVNEIKAIEEWLSSWKEGSITSNLNNKAANRPISVSDEYYQLVQRCLGISELTQGAFDISFGGLSELYTFDKQEHALPDLAMRTIALAHVGYNKIELTENQQIFFKDSHLRIGFGAIGKGFAADRVRETLKSKGVSGGVINASGDLTAWGNRANGDEWKVGIPDPDNNENILLWLPMENKAIATSGDYEKYFMSDGVRYSHIINPLNGLPVVGSSSVSVISNSAEMSDALATAVSVLGVDFGLNLINQIDGVECVFIDNNRKLHFSDGLQTYAY